MKHFRRRAFAVVMVAFASVVVAGLVTPAAQAAPAPLTTQAAAVTSVASAPATTPTTGYLTLVFGRSQMVSTSNKCKAPTPGAKSLFDIAAGLKTMGLMGTGTIVLQRIADTELCQGKNTQASWSDVQALQNNDNWRFVSQTEQDVTKMSLAQQQQVICGSLPAFSQHGLLGSNGMFAYAGHGNGTTAAQTNVTQKCFDFGRLYSVTGSNNLATMGAPWYQGTFSVIGGRCNDASLPCYNMAVKNNQRSDTYASLVQAMSPGPGIWNSIQMYRLVSGKSTASDSWDCTPTNPDDRWTSIPEEFCWETYFAALTAARTADPSAINADPAAVAVAIGRAGSVPGY